MLKTEVLIAQYLQVIHGSHIGSSRPLHIVQSQLSSEFPCRVYLAMDKLSVVIPWCIPFLPKECAGDTPTTQHKTMAAEGYQYVPQANSCKLNKNGNQWPSSHVNSTKRFATFLCHSAAQFFWMGCRTQKNLFMHYFVKACCTKSLGTAVPCDLVPTSVLCLWSAFGVLLTYTGTWSRSQRLCVSAQCRKRAYNTHFQHCVLL